MIYLTTQEQSIIKTTLLKIFDNAIGNIQRDYVVDVIINAELPFIATVDCTRHTVRLKIKTTEFDVKESKQLTLTAVQREDVPTSELEALTELNKIGTEKLKKLFDDAIRERDELHEVIAKLDHVVTEAINNPEVKIIVPKKKGNTPEDIFNGYVQAVKETIGFERLSTEVKLDTSGTITVESDFKTHKIVIRESTVRFNSSEKFNHVLLYDTIIKKPIYTMNDTVLPIQEIYVSLDCSIEYKKACETMIKVLDEIIDTDERTLEKLRSTIVPNDAVEEYNGKFNAFKKTTIE